MANYQEELNKFREKWNLPNYNLNELAESIQQFRYVDAFLMNTSVDNSPAGQYVKWFSRTLSLYFAANTTPNEKGKYISSFKAQEFYDSFKALAQAKYDADAQEKNEEPLQVQNVTEGQKKNLENVIANCKRNYQRTLPDMWQENLRKGILDIDKLKPITNKAYNEMMGNVMGDKEKMNGELTNIVAACEAMKQLRASRSGVWGWLWKVIFNRDQNRQEKEYLNELTTKINDLKIMKYKVDEKLTEVTGKTILGKDVKAETKENAKEVNKTNSARSNDKAVKIEPVAVKINHKTHDAFFKGELAKMCYRAIPEKAQKVISETLLRFTIAPELILNIDKHNMKFDDGIKAGNEPKAEMERIITTIFKISTYHIETHAEDLSNELKLETTKAIAKVVANTMTAAAIYPNELGGFVDEYIEQNAKNHGEIVDFYKKEMARIRGEELNESREPVFSNGDNFTETNANKSEPIIQQQKPEASRLDIK